MRPNLTLLSAKGAIIYQTDLPHLYQNAIRHLALTGDTLAIAMPWEGAPAEPVGTTALSPLRDRPQAALQRHVMTPYDRPWWAEAHSAKLSL